MVDLKPRRPTVNQDRINDAGTMILALAPLKDRSPDSVEDAGPSSGFLATWLNNGISPTIRPSLGLS